MMADLPREGCTEVAPFTYCGADMFGPLIIKERRSKFKRYGALFTFFSSRLVHIELTNSLDADSFLLALRRYMVWRGTVRSIRSDNGTNFVSAKNELQRAFKEIKHDKIKSFLQENGADGILWHNNPPGASHMGRVWERQIRSARIILKGLLKTHSHTLNDESLRTLKLYLVMSCHSWSEVHLNHTSFVHWLFSSLKDLFFLHFNWYLCRKNSTVAWEKCDSMEWLVNYQFCLSNLILHWIIF